MTVSGPILFSYFLYFDEREIHIGYGTQLASQKTLSKGRRIGKERFVTREEAEAARMKWREKFHLTSTIHAESALLR
jgi:hypothetical protein